MCANLRRKKNKLFKFINSLRKTYAFFLYVLPDKWSA